MAWTCERCGRTFATSLHHAAGRTCAHCYRTLSEEEQSALGVDPTGPTPTRGASGLAVVAYVAAAIFLFWGIIETLLIDDIAGSGDVPAIFIGEPAVTGMFRALVLVMAGAILTKVEDLWAAPRQK